MTHREKTGLTWVFIGLFLLIVSDGITPVGEMAETLGNAMTVTSLVLWMGGMIAFVYGLLGFSK